MSAISQIIRTSGRTQNNPSGFTSDILQITQSLADVGAPSEDIGIVGNTYIDTVTGIQYQKGLDGWVPVVDIAAVGPPPSIPDPLSINQLNINRIQGNASDDVTIDAGNIGKCQILSNAADALQIGQVGSEDGVKIQNNGNVIAGSLVRGFRLSALGGANEGSLGEVGGNMELSNAGSNGLIIENKAVGQNVEIKTSGGEVLTDSNLNMANNEIIDPLAVVTNSADLTLQAKGSNVVSVKNVVSQEFIRMDGNNAAEYKMTITNPVSSNSVVVKGVGAIEKTGTADLNIEHTGAGNINLRTPSGVIRMNDGGPNNITFDPALKLGTVDNLQTTNINNSSILVNNSLLNVNTSGVLSWRAYPRCIEMIQSGFGGNGTSYFNLGTSTVGPGEFWATCTGNGRSLAEVDIRVISNAAWNLGGVGTASIEIGYVPNNLPVTAANFNVIRSVNISNSDDIYGVSYTGYNDSIPFRGAIAARSVLTGTSATATNVEITLNLTLV